jgi:hypothetical protein
MRHAIVAAALALAAAAPILGAGWGTKPGYTGTRFPYTAAAFDGMTPGGFSGFQPVWYLDADGDRTADYSHALGRVDGNGNLKIGFLSQWVSPSDPTVIYGLTTGRDLRGGPHHQFVRLEERDGRLTVAWRDELLNYPFFSSGYVPRDHPGIYSRSHPIQTRRMPGGGDAILVELFDLRRYDNSQLGYAVLKDGPDPDPWVDTWVGPVYWPDLQAIAWDQRGNILARRLKEVGPRWSLSSGYVLIRDTDGDFLADTLEDAFAVPEAFPNAATYGPGDWDLGADRVYNAQFPHVHELDSWHRPVPNRQRLFWEGTGQYAISPRHLLAGRDGMPIMLSNGLVYKIATLDDPNFNGLCWVTVGPNREAIHLVLEEPDMLPGWIANIHLADLAELPLDGAGRARVVFAEAGEFPGPEYFTFRLGGLDHPECWIDANGTVSFTGVPVTGEATLANLSRFGGVLAPCWSDQWDTSRLRVHAGLVPVTRSFTTGERVLAFAVEWRGLRAPGWEPEREAACRLIMYSDGTYRVDFGAFEASELGGMRLVTGHAGLGTDPSMAGADASSHSWNGTVGDYRAARTAGEAFSAEALSDLGHLWTRWAGCPQQLGASPPPPTALDPTLKKGKKLVLSAAGSGIQPGAWVVFENAEWLPLTLSANGKKWVVAKTAASSPSGFTVEQLWNAGIPHQIEVVNPDGGRSAPVIVPP